jgi:putative phosphoesterase
MTILGVLADTHVPDRVRALSPESTAIFKDADVDAILHAGDVIVPAVLRALSTIAPVYAVRGNRDWLALRHLPASRWLEFEGVKIALTHGHGWLWHYLVDKVREYHEGYQAERYQPYLLSAFPEAGVIVFGHTHRPMNQWVKGKLLFNPGSPHPLDPEKAAPSLGLLTIRAGGEVEGKIISLG